jgi:hypothetical protein
MMNSLRQGNWKWGFVVAGLPGLTALLVAIYENHSFGLGFLFTVASLLVMSVANETIFVDQWKIRLSNMILMIGIVLGVDYMYSILHPNIRFRISFDYLQWYLHPVIVPMLSVLVVRGLVKIFKKLKSA